MPPRTRAAIEKADTLHTTPHFPHIMSVRAPPSSSSVVGLCKAILCLSWGPVGPYGATVGPLWAVMGGQKPERARTLKPCKNPNKLD